MFHQQNIITFVYFCVHFCISPYIDLLTYIDEANVQVNCIAIDFYITVLH